MALEDLYNPGCFACGTDNNCGLKLSIEAKKGEALTVFVLDERYEGWKGIAHGGIIATILDEVMAWAVISLGHAALTAALEIRYRSPMFIGKSYRAIAKVKEGKNRKFIVESFIEGIQGDKIAEAKGVYVRVPEEKLLPR